MEIPEMQVKVRIETDVIMDVGLMAKAFAYMQSDEQAKFLALVHQEMGSYGGEMQMLSIKDQLDKQPDAREFIRTLYEMTMVEEKPSPIDDFRKAKAMIEADVGFRPAHHNVLTEVAKRYYAQAAMAEKDFAGQYMNDFGCNPDELPDGFNDKVAEEMSSPIDDFRRARDSFKAAAGLASEPLQVISTDVSWPGLGEARSGSTFASFARAKVTCLCKGLTGVRYKVDDHVHVQRTFTVGKGRVIAVRGGDVLVLMDAAKSAAIPHSHRITVDGDSVYITGGSVYTLTSPGYPGLYIGTVAEKHDDGTMTIEVGQGVDAAILDTVSRNKKAVGDLITSDDPVSPSHYDARTACDECKGTGTWTNPANNETSPCSKGCKP